LPAVLLRRRLPLSDLADVVLSKQADDFICIRVKSATLKAPDQSFWVPDSEANACQITQTPFGFFSNRRHHCRFTGQVRALAAASLIEPAPNPFATQVCIDAVCNYMTMLPDLGWTSPQRICDEVIGLPSVEGQEDIIIVSDKKSEILAMVTSVCSALSVKFTDDIPLTAHAHRPLSQLPAASLTFTTSQSKTNECRVEWSPTTLRVHVPPGFGHSSPPRALRWSPVTPSRRWRDAGVPDSVVADRRKRQEKRLKAREARLVQERERMKQRAAERYTRFAARTTASLTTRPQ
jgi:hypothetical protein